MANIKDIANKKKNLAAIKNPVITEMPAPIEISTIESKQPEIPADPQPEEVTAPISVSNQVTPTIEQPAIPIERSHELSNSDLFNALLSKEREYNNGRQTVILDTQLKAKLDILGKYTDCHISRILNNLLYLLFESNTQYNIGSEISKLIAKQQSSISKQFK